MKIEWKNVINVEGKVVIWLDLAEKVKCEEKRIVKVNYFLALKKMSRWGECLSYVEMKIMNSDAAWWLFYAHPSYLNVLLTYNCMPVTLQFLNVWKDQFSFFISISSFIFIFFCTCVFDAFYDDTNMKHKQHFIFYFGNLFLHVNFR